MKNKKKILGVCVTGGVATGINDSLITLWEHANIWGYEKVLFFLDGFKHLTKGPTNKYLLMNEELAFRYKSTGGSILGNSKPGIPEEHEYKNIYQSIIAHEITDWVQFGGNDSYEETLKVFSHGDQVRWAHVP